MSVFCIHVNVHVEGIINIQRGFENTTFVYLYLNSTAEYNSQCGGLSVWLDKCTVFCSNRKRADLSIMVPWLLPGVAGNFYQTFYFYTAQYILYIQNIDCNLSRTSHCRLKGVISHMVLGQVIRYYQILKLLFCAHNTNTSCNWNDQCLRKNRSSSTQCRG